MMSGLNDYEQLLYDGFAQAALPGIIEKTSGNTVISKPEYVAKMAFDVADAMFKERKLRIERRKNG